MKIKLVIGYIMLLSHSILYANSFVTDLKNAFSSYSTIRNNGISIMLELSEYSLGKEDAEKFTQKLENLPLFADDNAGLEKILLDYRNRTEHVNFSRISVKFLASNYKAICLHSESKSLNKEKIVSDIPLTFSAIGELISAYDSHSKKLVISTVPEDSVPYSEIPFVRMFLLNPYLIANPPLQFTSSSIKILNNRITTVNCLKLCTERMYEMKENFPILLRMRVFSKNNEAKEENRLLLHYRGYKLLENKFVPGIYYPSILIESTPSVESIQQIKVVRIKTITSQTIKEDDLEIKIDKDTKIYPYLDEINAR